jgi:hypothetical protein
LARGDEEQPRRVIPAEALKAEAAGVDAAPDDRATLEATQLSQGAKQRDLAKEAQEKEHDRSQAFKDHFETLSLLALNVLFAGFLSLAAIWALHLVLPEKAAAKGVAFYVHGWLTKDQLDHITGLLAGGVIAGLVADHFKRRMG